MGRKCKMLKCNVGLDTHIKHWHEKALGPIGGLPEYYGLGSGRAYHDVFPMCGFPIVCEPPLDPITGKKSKTAKKSEYLLKPGIKLDGDEVYYLKQWLIKTHDARWQDSDSYKNVDIYWGFCLHHFSPRQVRIEGEEGEDPKFEFRIPIETVITNSNLDNRVDQEKFWKMPMHILPDKFPETIPKHIKHRTAIKFETLTSQRAREKEFAQQALFDKLDLLPKDFSKFQHLIFDPKNREKWCCEEQNPLEDDILLYQNNENSICFYSKSKFQDTGIPCYTLEITTDFHVVTYHCGIKVMLPIALGSHHKFVLTRWSELLQIFVQLSNWESEMTKMKDKFQNEIYPGDPEYLKLQKRTKWYQKYNIWLEQGTLLSHRDVKKVKYTPAKISRDFESYVVSRSAYELNSAYYEQASTKLLQRLTSSVSKFDEVTYYSKIFDNFENDRKICCILFDEIYVKKMLQYHGGKVFGLALNQNEIIAKKQKAAQKLKNKELKAIENENKKAEKEKKAALKAEQKKAKLALKAEQKKAKQAGNKRKTSENSAKNIDKKRTKQNLDMPSESAPVEASNSETSEPPQPSVISGGSTASEVADSGEASVLEEAAIPQPIETTSENSEFPIFRIDKKTKKKRLIQIF